MNDFNMKICFFIDSLSKGAGTERITVDVAKALVKRGYHIEFLLLDSNINSFFELDSRIKINSLNSSFGKKRKSISGLRTFLCMRKPDFLINVAFQMAIISLPASIGMSCKIITWDHFFLNAGSFMGYLMRLVSATLGYKQIVLTETDKLGYPFFCRKKIECIPNFTNLNPNRICSSLDSKIVLSVGRLNSCKGFDLLIESWKTVSVSHPDWNLKIVGDGADRKLLNDLVIKYELLDSISILPPTKDILSLYLESSIYVLSSRFESFGLVLIEAKSCGLPIVAFDCPYGPRHIIKENIDGVLINNNNINELSKGLCSLISNRKRQKDWGSAAILDYEKNWSEESVLAKWKSVF